MKGRHPKLHPPRHHHPICRPGHGHRRSDYPEQTPPPAPRVPGIPQTYREVDSRAPGHPSDRGQLIHAQEQPCPCLARPPAPPPRALHPVRLLLPQPGGAPFGIITQLTIRGGSFSSVKERIAKIEQFVTFHNNVKRPFNWTAATDSIPGKPQRLNLANLGSRALNFIPKCNISISFFDCRGWPTEDCRAIGSEFTWRLGGDQPPSIASITPSRTSTATCSFSTRLSPTRTSVKLSS